MARVDFALDREAKPGGSRDQMGTAIGAVRTARLDWQDGFRDMTHMLQPLYWRDSVVISRPVCCIGISDVSWLPGDVERPRVRI